MINVELEGNFITLMLTYLKSFTIILKSTMNRLGEWKTQTINNQEYERESINLKPYHTSTLSDVIQIEDEENFLFSK